jgi:flagellar hook-length control protein FliK
VLAAQLVTDASAPALPIAAAQDSMPSVAAAAGPTAPPADPEGNSEDPQPAPDPFATALLGMALPTPAVMVPASPASPGAAPAVPQVSAREAVAVRSPLPAPRHAVETALEPAEAASPPTAPPPVPAILAGARDQVVPPAPAGTDSIDRTADTQKPEDPARSHPLMHERSLTEARPSMERITLESPVRVGSRAFADDLGQRVMWMASNGQHAAELRVDPPQLGPVEVRLTVSGDQASLTLLSPHASVRDALQSSLPRLHEMLVTAGIDLGSVHVGSHAPGQDGTHDPQTPRDVPLAWAGQPPSAAGEVLLVPRRGLVDIYA